MIDFKELRTDEMLSFLQDEYDITPVRETEREIIFPTVCHGGNSNKLYYYKNTKLFKCYTQCSKSFDIFDLVIKIEKRLTGKEFSRGRVLKKLGVKKTNLETVEKDVFKEMRKLSTNKKIEIKNIPSIGEGLLELFDFDNQYLDLWRNEGISEKTLIKFGIRYDQVQRAIVIPHRDIKGNLIGIRGRFVNPKGAKYMPIQRMGRKFSHPTGSNLYGLYENLDNIKKANKIIIFEGEKSVLKFEDEYPFENISVAICGNSITTEQINLIKTLNLETVIIAFDRDYRTKEEANLELDRISKMVKILFSIAEVKILIDWNFILDHKDSPIDKGIDTYCEIEINSKQEF